MNQNNPTFNALRAQAGVHFAYDMAMDAQAPMITSSNAGVPAFLSNFVSPETIKVLLAPMKAAQILGEKQLGDWTTKTATFPMIELTGEVSSYGDFNNNGSSGANMNLPQRQSYHYQTTSRWGELQLDTFALAKIDYVSKINEASILALNKFQNKTYFFGVAGLQNYGLLNDPSLSAPIVPSAAWSLGSTTSDTIYADVVRLFAKLVVQGGGNIDMDAKMVLVMSPAASVALTKTNQYLVNVKDLLAKNFSNLRFETAVEYSTASGELVQLIVEEIEGQKTATAAFTEKLRAHRVVAETSAWVQKKSQGTFGTVIYQPFAIAQMLGV
jgi:hypothetical protein